jgi:hypothetical protein
VPARCRYVQHYSYAVGYTLGERDEIKPVKLTLTKGAAQYEAEGIVRLDPIEGRSNFESERDVQNKDELRTLEGRLLSVLNGSGNITLAPGEPSGAPRSLQIPLAGLAPALERFREICFR